MDWREVAPNNQGMRSAIFSQKINYHHLIVTNTPNIAILNFLGLYLLQKVIKNLDKILRVSLDVLLLYLSSQRCIFF